ncbi:MAG: ABC transporter permease [Microthrixaceae bacterium]
MKSGADIGRPRAETRSVPLWAVLPASLAMLFLVGPVLGLLGRADWSTFVSDITSTESMQALRLSVGASLAAVALVVFLGLPLAWTLARVEFPGRKVARALVVLPMVMPPVVGGVALLSALGRDSVVGGWLYDVSGVQFTFSTLGVVLAEAFVAMPFFVLTVEAALRSTGRRHEELAATLGASAWTVLWRVTLPTARPAIAAGAVLAWARALGEFGATITFAGNIAGRTRTLPLAVYLGLDGDPGGAVALSIVLLVVSLVVLVGLRDRWLLRP